ncbi:hypothetical protein IV203_010410 [Nitzschia inconspicua]|uniref:Uncharacterized protein n=1 Tax=Nitzschia inconspicua TaxID=303405 RepID=A0A9K3KW25_9STRA|nr:hypothetical protein IV203_010410 [Nitzschia inconspicua]
MMEHFTDPDELVGGGADKNYDKRVHNQHPGNEGSMSFESFGKIQIDFDACDLSGTEGILDDSNDDFDKLLTKMVAKETAVDVVGNGIDPNQLDLDLNDNLSLENERSVSSLDKLLTMNIIEMDGFEKTREDGHNSDLLREFAKEFLSQEENIGQQPQQEYLRGNVALPGRMCGGEPILEEQCQQQIQLQHQLQMLMQRQQEQYQLQKQIEQQKQMMKMQAMLQQQQEQQQKQKQLEKEEEVSTASKVSQLASMGSADLEREKVKLLSRLQEINARKSNPLSMSMMQQTQSQPHAPGVASVMNHSDHGSSSETPLSAFLRNKNKSAASPSAQASMLSQNGPDAMGSSGIFDAVPMDFGGSMNPFLRRATGGSIPSSSQNMIRPSLSGHNLRASGMNLKRHSGQNLVESRGSGLSGGNHNAVWGSSGVSPNRRTGVSSFASSGILPRHLSDGHLLAGATTVSASLAKSKNRMGSLSRENALYNMLNNKQGSHKGLNTLNRNSSHSRLSKSGSRGSISNSDSFRAMLPTKRSGGRVGSKYKIGTSTSVPHLMVRDSDTSSLNNYGGNALW